MLGMFGTVFGMNLEGEVMEYNRPLLNTPDVEFMKALRNTPEEGRHRGLLLANAWKPKSDVIGGPKRVPDVAER